ncbi:Natural resistance-associated macrophage protein superfamily protein [Haloferax sp. BAB-2207]|nr:Natural resistance-associated macrophage protein superfamily protein [Haloferax sp. BAB-2207]
MALFSGVGAFLGGAFFPLLVLVLAFGLVGTPFAIAVVLVLLNGDAVSEPNSTLANLGGVVLFAVTTVLAANFVRSRALSDLGDPLSVFVVVFAAAMGAATLGLLGKFVRETVGRPTAA